MYIITKNAAWWEDTPTDPERHQRITQWAERPLRTSHGTCLAIGFLNDEVRVLVERNRERQWLPIARVMSEAQVRQWIKVGFARRR
jgi:hypothetical protein